MSSGSPISQPRPRAVASAANIAVATVAARPSTPPAAGATLARRPRSTFTVPSRAVAVAAPISTPSRTELQLRRRSRTSTFRAAGSMTMVRRRDQPMNVPTTTPAIPSTRTRGSTIGTSLYQLRDTRIAAHRPCVKHLVQASVEHLLPGGRDVLAAVAEPGVNRQHVVVLVGVPGMDTARAGAFLRDQCAVGRLDPQPERMPSVVSENQRVLLEDDLRLVVRSLELRERHELPAVDAARQGRVQLLAANHLLVGAYDPVAVPDLRTPVDRAERGIGRHRGEQRRQSLGEVFGRLTDEPDELVPSRLGLCLAQGRGQDILRYGQWLDAVPLSLAERVAPIECEASRPIVDC